MQENTEFLLAYNEEKQEEKTQLEQSLKQESQAPTEFISPLTGSYFSGIGMLFFMLFVLYMILWAMKKFGKGRYIPISTLKRDDIRVEARVPLDAKKTLYVVKYMDKRLLIGGSDSAITLLSEDYYIEKEAEELENKANKESRQGFKEKLQLFNKEMNKK